MIRRKMQRIDSMPGLNRNLFIPEIVIECKETENEFGILPTKLYSLNRDVDSENDKELNNLVLKNENLEFYQYDLEYEVLKSGLKNVEEKINKEKPTEMGFLSFCYEVCLTLGSLYQAANANCESFAFTFFASTTGLPQS